MLSRQVRLGTIDNLQLFGQRDCVIERVIAAHHDGRLSQVAHAKHVAQLRVGLVKEEYSGILAWRQLVESGGLVGDDEHSLTIAGAHIAVLVMLIHVGYVQRTAGTSALQTSAQVKPR